MASSGEAHLQSVGDGLSHVVQGRQANAVALSPVSASSHILESGASKGKLALSSCAPTPCVADSLVLSNNSLIAGNISWPSSYYQPAMVDDWGKGEVFVFGVNNKVAVVSLATHSIVSWIQTGIISEVSAAAYDPMEGEVFAVEGNQGTVAVINDTNNKVVTTIPISAGFGIAYDSARHEMFVSQDQGSDYLYTIDDSNLTATAHPSPGWPGYGVAYDPVKSEIAVVHSVSSGEIALT